MELESATAGAGSEVCFLGDYLDDFFDTPELSAATAAWVRRQIEAGHRLLWGNHDLPYAFLPKRHPCAGYSAEKAKAVAKVLSPDHWKKLRLFHIVPAEPRPWILSHAGIHRAWLEGAKDPVARLLEIEEEALDGLYRRRTTHPILHFCSASRGGRDPYPGVLWMDWGDFQPINGINQIVGHTPLHNPDEYSHHESVNWCLDTHLRHYGVLENGELRVHRFPVPDIRMVDRE